MIDGSQTPADIGRRIEMLRRALGMNQAAFAKMLELSQPLLSNYESGFRRPDLDKAMIVASKTGATLDWIYMGIRSGLPVHLAERLEPFPPAEKKAG